MKIDISSVFRSPDSSVPFDATPDISGIFPEFSDVRAVGKAVNTEGVIVFDAVISGIFHSVCDRCGKDTEVSVETQIHTVLDFEGAKDDSVVIDSGRIDIDATAADALLLARPMQTLCSADCPGIRGEGYELIINDENE